jgi:hypothetical protein
LSLSTQSSNSVYSENTRQTTFSTGNSTQSTMQMSSVASMVSDTRTQCTTSTQQRDTEWTVVRPNKNNNLTKIREAGLKRLLPKTQHHKSGNSSKFNRYDPNGTIQHKEHAPSVNSPTLDIPSSKSKDLCTPPASQSICNEACEDRVT